MYLAPVSFHSACARISTFTSLFHVAQRLFVTSARKVKGQGSVARLRIPLVEDRLDYAATGGMACMP